MTNLKPCSFCENDSEAEVVDHHFGIYSVYCSECGESTQQVQGYDKAVENWNMKWEGG